jgi:PAS domain-containing protein
MTVKIKHIASIFTRFSPLVVIITGLLTTLFVLSSHKKQAIGQAIKATENVSIHISYLHSNIDRALSSQKTDASFVSLLSDNLISEHTHIINNLIDSLKEFNKIGFVQRYFSENRLADTLINKLKVYNHDYQLVLYSLKEKGNKDDGAIRDLYVQTKKLYKGLLAAPDSGKMASRLDEITEGYFDTYEINDLGTYLQFTEQISGELYELEGFEVYKLEETIENIQNILASIKTIDTRLFGSEDSEGQLKELELELQDLITFSHRLSDQVIVDTSKYSKWWGGLFLFVVVPITILVLLFLRNISKKIKKNINKLLEETSNITAGDVGKEIKIDDNSEFGLIFENLRKHKTELLNRKNFISELLEEKFEREIEILSEQDEIGVELNKLESKLLKAQKEQNARAKENEIRRYINEGLAKFSDIMRTNSNDTTALGDNLIRNLVKYLNALQGSLFLTSKDNDKLLNLIAAFAYDRKKYLTKTIRFGEGLVGTCAIELKTINMTKVPPEYINITSGLGDTPPNNIFIVPVQHENKIVGVLELASLNSFNDFEINLTEQIADNLASTIISARNNTRTAQLLEKSQQQALEMAEQEEEMRQNMEELKATQEESARREEEMQGIIDAIGTTFYVIEYNPDGIIEHINDRLVTFLEQPYESIIGHKHIDIFSAESKITTNQIQDIVQNKKSEKLVEELNWGSKRFRYTHSISPIMSKYNEVIKIINLMIIEESNQTNDD